MPHNGKEMSVRLHGHADFSFDDATKGCLDNLVGQKLRQKLDNTIISQFEAQKSQPK